MEPEPTGGEIFGEEDDLASRFQHQLTIRACSACGHPLGYGVTEEGQDRPLYCARADCYSEGLLEWLAGGEDKDVPLVEFVTYKRREEPEVESEGDFKAVSEVQAVAPVENGVKPVVEEKKIWTLRDLELDPAFRSGGKYVITKSLSLTDHVLQPAGKEGRELVWNVWFTMLNYQLNVELEPLKEVPEINQICFVDSSSALQRAVTTGVDSVNQTVAVKYLDFGGLDCVKLEDCYHVCPKIMRKLPVIALEVRMHGPTYLLAGKQLSLYLPLFKQAEVEIDMKDEIDCITWVANLIRSNGQTLVEKMCSIEAGPQENWDEDDC